MKEAPIGVDEPQSLQWQFPTKMSQVVKPYLYRPDNFSRETSSVLDEKSGADSQTRHLIAVIKLVSTNVFQNIFVGEIFPQVLDCR